MDPKKKAIELVEKYKPYVHGYVGSSMLSNYEYPEQILKQAKKVAIISVKQIRSIVPYETYKDTLSPYDGAELSTDYWDEVIYEIKNLNP